MKNLFGNIRYSIRQFRRAPVFTITATLTLALGIGGTTAIFTLMHEVMLRSLPVADPATLYRIGEGDDCCVEGGPQDRWGMFPYTFYQRLKAETPEFADLAAFQAGGARLSVRRESETAAKPMRTEYVTGNYFSTFGVGAIGGRVLNSGDDQPSSPPVVVVSHRAWQNTYASDRGLIGSTIVIEAHPFTVVGIAPPGFFGETLRSDPPDIWIPLQQEALLDGERALLKTPFSAWLRVIGRLKPGASVDGMAPRLTTMLRNWMRKDAGYPANWLTEIDRVLPNQSINVIPAGAGVAVMKEEYGRSLKILLAVCSLVLLIACANLANLLLARAAARRNQTAVRLAIGASRRDIVAQALTESILLAILGGIVGLIFAVGAAKLLLVLAFTDAQFLPISTMPSFLVLGITFVIALVTGVIFGAAPAWFATRTDPSEAIRGIPRSSDHSSLARKVLLVTQATLSVVLVAGATMLGRSLNKLESQDFGYPVAGRTLVEMHYPTRNYTQAKIAAVNRELEQRIKSLPGVQGGGIATYNPLTNNWGELILVAGHPAPKFNEEAGASWDRVSSTYLQDLGVNLVRGRYFTDADNENTENVAIVNEAFVKRFFKQGEDPMDQHFGLDVPELVNTFRIVGIVRDAKFAGWGLDKPARPMFYVALAQWPKYENELMRSIDTSSHLVQGALLVTNIPSGTLEPQLTRELAQVDPNITINSIRTLKQQVELSFDQQRAVASLAGLFGVVALLLAAVGLYGVTAYTVARQTNEIGIRMALGADRQNVVRLVLQGAFMRVVVGLLLGVPMAIGAAHLISSQLYGIRIYDPPALGLAAGSLTVCAFIAALIPATRAASIDPMIALRAE
jgi:predicted permease